MGTKSFRGSTADIMSTCRLLLLLSIISTVMSHKSSCHPLEVDQPWDYLLLAQFWPPTSCYAYFGKEHCEGISKSVSGWTIHGLWPSKPGSEGPQCCDNSDPFDYNLIKSLSPELKMQWPYYNTSAEKDHLWAHEWNKHGTCAKSIPALKGEMNYFSSTLKLQKPLNISGMLAKQNIIPSAKILYKPEEFFEAIKTEYGVLPNIGCFYDHKTKQNYIEQIWLCFTKDLKLRDCPTVSSLLPLKRHGSHYNECPHPESRSLHYLPFVPSKRKESALYFLSEINGSLSWH